MIEIQTKAAKIVGHFENSCTLQDAKSPNLVLVSNLPLYSISLKLVFEAPDIDEALLLICLLSNEAMR